MLLSILELVKIVFGQLKSRSFFNILYYFFYLLSFSINTINYNTLERKQNITFSFKTDFLFLLILIICIIELVSWNFMKSPFNTQALNAINLNVLITEQAAFIPYLLFVLILCFSLMLFPFINNDIKIPQISLIVKMIHCILMFIFILTIFHDFHAKSNNPLFDSLSNSYFSVLKKMIDDKFDMNAQILNTTGQLKNLILVQLESFPGEFVNDPKIAPNLNNFSKMFEYISPISPQPFTLWSFAGMLVTETGMPQIYPDPEWRTLASGNDYLYVLNIKSLPDFLYSINYTLNFFETGTGKVMGFDRWIGHHKYNKAYSAKNDLYLYNHLADDYLPKMDKIVRESNFKSHFLSLIINANTHLPYARPKWCKLDFQDLPENQKPFYCVDFALKKFLNSFIDLKMYEHTLLVLFPDHPPFQTNYKELFMIFPGMKKVEKNSKINGEITYYDFAPTVLDLIGIKSYQPVFPYGRNIYQNSDFAQKYCVNKFCIQRKPKPDLDDMSIIYKVVHFDHGKNINAYNLSNPFACRINGTGKIYYSEKPCLSYVRARGRTVPRTTLY